MQLTVSFCPQLIPGGVVSTTVTVKLPPALFPWVSLAEQLTVVVPSGNESPEAGEQLTGRDPSQASKAEAEKVTTAPPTLLHSTPVMFAGRVRTGASLSVTVTS